MEEIFVYGNRTEAGRALAVRLLERKFENPVVLALPRGGVPVAYEIAKALHAPLDLVLVRKIGVPGQPELAVGAVVDGDRPEVVINQAVRQLADISDTELSDAKDRETLEIERRRELYFQGIDRAKIEDSTAIVVDDGIATGATVRASLIALRRNNPRKLVLAVPVAPSDTVERLQADVDDLICLQTPEPFYAIGFYYRDFRQVDDKTVVRLLNEAQAQYPDLVSKR